MASTYIERTFGSTTNRRTFTYSVWVKRGADNVEHNILSSGNFSGNPYLDARFNANGTIEWYHYTTGYQFRFTTNRQFRDLSGWYHLVFATDTTQSTQSNRCKLYVNGVQETSFSNETYPSQDYDLAVNYSGYKTSFGSLRTNATFDGSMAHVHFTDGTAYDASYFGSTDATTGIWKPKTAPSVTYGTNGFFLKFANSGSMGTDSSGNGNNFSVAAGTLTQTQDTPSNIFCTLNPLKKHSGQTLSNLNLTSVGANSANLVSSTLAVSKGKWYFEFKLVSANSYAVFIYPYNLYKVGDDIFSANYTVGFYSTSPSLYRNGSDTGSLGGGVANNDIIQVAMDLDNNNIYFGKNGNWNDGLGGGFDQSDFSNATGHTLTRNSSYDDIGILTLNGASGSSYTLDWNFGNGYFGTTAVSSANADGAGYGLFEYAPPTNYYSLCTKNINTYG